jgi:alpha-tubulin suppressor-like RCC1 family protein
VLSLVLSAALGASASAAPGNLFSFGSNDWGQLGDGSQTNRSLPVAVLGSGGPLSSIVQVACGGYHAVALAADGSVWTWGQNGYGQLGLGGTGAPATQATQVHGVGGGGFLTDVVQVAAGWAFSVALRRDGTVVTWGIGSQGQLGDGGTANQSAPVVVNGIGGTGTLGDVVAIACGEFHVIALRADGTVVSWGQDSYGVLGDGGSANRSFPVSVLGLGGPATAVAASSVHSMALMNDHTVKTWGYGLHGELGNGSASNSMSPVQVLAVGGSGMLSNVTAIFGGLTHCLALLGDGTMVAWGTNSAGQLGDNSSTDRSTPVPVQAVGGGGHLASVVGIAAGSSHSLALLRDGTAVAWGAASSGQLGDGQGSNRLVPVVVQQVGGGGALSSLSHVSSGPSSNSSIALAATYRAVDHAVGNDGLSRILYWAPGAGSNSIRIDTLAASGQTKSTVATFDPPAGTPRPIDMVLADTDLILLFADSAGSLVSVAVLPESGGSLVRTLPTPIPSGFEAMNLDHMGPLPILWMRVPGAGGNVSACTIPGIAKGFTLELGPVETLDNPLPNPVLGWRGAVGRMGSGGVKAVLYNTYQASGSGPCCLASYTSATTWSAIPFGAPGVGTDFCLGTFNHA